MEFQTAHLFKIPFMRDLLQALDRAIETQTDVVYCSVVETRGSTPQKAGASMLVFPDGRQTGTLGGGCVEAEVKRQALHTLGKDEHGTADVHDFCLDDNYGWDDGLICGGRMKILADPIRLSTSDPERRTQLMGYYRQFRDLVEKGQGCTEAVVSSDEIGVAVGSRYLFDTTGQLLTQLGEAPPPLLREKLIPLAKRPKPYHVPGICYLPVLPRITLFIVGGGHVGQAVAKLAAEVDFDIWVLDDREAYANRDRFPSAQRHLVGDIGQKLAQMAKAEIHRSIYALIVTRGHAHDEEALYHLATTSAGYVGMIGSKRKIKLIFEDLIARGISKEALDRVHAPLGFHIGSQTVPEIAVSIVAELIACRNLGATIPAARIQLYT